MGILQAPHPQINGAAQDSALGLGVGLALCPPLTAGFRNLGQWGAWLGSMVSSSREHMKVLVGSLEFMDDLPDSCLFANLCLHLKRPRL